jgi:hypothetical protein
MSMRSNSRWNSIDAIDVIISDAAELDAADPRNITDEDRAWADGMRARMKERIDEYRRTLALKAESSATPVDETDQRTE